MTVVVRIALFAASLVGVFVIAAWVGDTFGPNPDIALPHPPSTSEHLHPHEEAGR